MSVNRQSRAWSEQRRAGIRFATRAALFCVLLLPLLLVGNRIAPAAEITPNENEFKVLSIIKLLGYVREWPEDVAPGEKGVLRIGIYGSDPFGPLLKGLVEIANKTPEKFDGRRIEIVEFTERSRIGECHVVYVPARRSLAWRTTALEGDKKGRLIICEDSQFPDMGGTFNLFVSGSSREIQYNRRNYRNSGVKIDSRVWRILEEVKE